VVIGGGEAASSLCHQGLRNRDASSELRAGISAADVAVRRCLESSLMSALRRVETVSDLGGYGQAGD
jgi:hypothetical protein